MFKYIYIHRWERERELAISRKREDFNEDDETRMKGKFKMNSHLYK